MHRDKLEEDLIDTNKQPTAPVPQTDSQTAIAAIEGLFNTHEARVLGAIGLFIGYICIFFTKIMNFTEMYIGVLGVVALTFLLLLLNKELHLRSWEWWVRSLAVVILSLILTSPQLYFAWTVSVSEVRAAAQVEQDRKTYEATNKFIQPYVTIENKKRGEG